MDVEGQLSPAPRLAIVGSRAARRTALATIPHIVDAAAEAGYSIISGGAVGVDVHAHRAALSAGVPQTVVLPLGRDRPYPPHHGELFGRIARARSSGVVFAQPPGTVPTRGMFASRNRIVVDLSRAVVVVQAGTRSGTMVTGRLALRAGRRLGVVRGSAGAGVLAADGGHWLGGVDASPTEVGDACARWLVGALDADRGVAHSEVPERLCSIVALASRAGARGIVADDCEAPVLALAALAEAEALGLLIQVAPGRYVAAL